MKADEKTSQNRNNNLVLLISIVLFALSLSQKCFCTEGACGQDWEGIALLISGCIGVFACPAWLVWLANPLLLFSWIYFNKKPQRSLVLNSISFLVAISFLFFREIITDEAGNRQPITGYQIGYWLWVTSSLILLFGNIKTYLIRKRHIQA